MSKKNDGGPAFPYRGPGGFVEHQGTQHEVDINATGMTLRDWFAGQALAGMIASRGIFEAMKEFKTKAVAGGMAPLEFERDIEFPGYANAAYRVADAMLKERQK
jgi:hypothetical protein